MDSSPSELVVISRASSGEIFGARLSVGGDSGTRSLSRYPYWGGLDRRVASYEREGTPGLTVGIEYQRICSKCSRCCSNWAA